MLGSVILLLGSAALLLWSAQRWLGQGGLSGRPGRLASRVWVPLLALAPALAAIPATAGAGLMGRGALLSGPMLGGFAVLALLVPAAFGTRADPWDAEHRVDLRWPAAGVVLLLVALAGRLTQSALMICFALGAVLPWAESIPRRGESWGGPGVGALSMALLGAAGMTAVMAIHAQPWMLLVVVVTAGWLLLLVARCMGGHGAIEAALWTATLGGLLGTGLLGWEALAASMGHLVAAGEPQVGQLGVLSVPALALLVPLAVLAGFPRWPPAGRVLAISGTGLLLATLVVTALV